MLISLVGQEVISSLSTKLLASCNVLSHTVLVFSDPVFLMVHFQHPTLSSWVQEIKPQMIRVRVQRKKILVIAASLCEYRNF
ncbi:hypothetical protein SAMN04488524_0688 [Pedobacter africanus]|uniref:Uncharacterized protein n=1 Tax=Pedobacter africanus TaxID=151894 RepID=A0A1W1ZGD3_9SPHI|nr:hypothetical protein SAMN04488524_0688 [Pedobacter africanus]